MSGNVHLYFHIVILLHIFMCTNFILLLIFYNLLFVGIFKSVSLYIYIYIYIVCRCVRRVGVGCVCVGVCGYVGGVVVRGV